MVWNHGTAWGYRRYGCRCDPCMAAMREHWRHIGKSKREQNRADGMPAKGEIPVLDADDPRHGTENAYVNYKCRCEKCRAEWARKTMDRRRRRNGDLKQTDTRHGNPMTYVNYDCRCERCVTAYADYRRDKRTAV